MPRFNPTDLRFTQELEAYNYQHQVTLRFLRRWGKEAPEEALRLVLELELNALCNVGLTEASLAFEDFEETAELVSGYKVQDLLLEVSLARKKLNRELEAFMKHDDAKWTLDDSYLKRRTSQEERDHHYALVEAENFWSKVLQIVQSTPLTMEQAARMLRKDPVYLAETAYRQEEHLYKEAMLYGPPHSQERLKNNVEVLKRIWRDLLDAQQEKQEERWEGFSPLGADKQLDARKKLAEYGIHDIPTWKSWSKKNHPDRFASKGAHVQRQQDELTKTVNGLMLDAGYKTNDAKQTL